MWVWTCNSETRDTFIYDKGRKPWILRYCRSTMSETRSLVSTSNWWSRLDLLGTGYKNLLPKNVVLERIWSLKLIVITWLQKINGNWYHYSRAHHTISFFLYFLSHGRKFSNKIRKTSLFYTLFWRSFTVLLYIV